MLNAVFHRVAVRKPSCSCMRVSETVLQPAAEQIEAHPQLGVLVVRKQALLTDYARVLVAGSRVTLRGGPAHVAQCR